MNNTNKIKTILFASLIAAMILPFSTMNFAEAEKTDKIGKDIIKNYKASKAMPQFKDVKEKNKDKSEEIQRIKHQEEHNKWLKAHLDEATEKIEAIRFLEYGRKIKMIETEYIGIGINTPEDLEAARVFLGEE